MSIEAGKRKLLEALAGDLIAKPPVPPSMIIDKLLKDADASVLADERDALAELKDKFIGLEQVVKTTQPGPLCRDQAVKQLRELFRLGAALKTEIAKTTAMLLTFIPEDGQMQDVMKQMEGLVSAVVRLSSFVPAFEASNHPMAVQHREQLRKQGINIRKEWEAALKKHDGDEDLAGIDMLACIVGEATDSGEAPPEVKKAMELLSRLAAEGADAKGSDETPAEAADEKETPWDAAIRKSQGS